MQTHFTCLNTRCSVWKKTESAFSYWDSAFLNLEYLFTAHFLKKPLNLYQMKEKLIFSTLSWSPFSKIKRL